MTSTGKIIEGDFIPAWWLPGGHLQTIYPPLFRSRPLLTRTREELLLPDGDFLDLDFYGKPNGKIAIILHGFTGSSNSPYVLGLQHSLAQLDIATAAVNFRGCSGRPNVLARSYHSGAVEDLDAVFEALVRRWPDAQIAVIGYSLGGNLALRWLAGRTHPQLTGVVAVSVPLVLQASVQRLNLGASRIYQRRFLRDLRAQMTAKQQLLLAKNPFEAERLAAHVGDFPFVSVRDFDHAVTAPLHGFNGAEDYYQRCSARYVLRDIRTPTLIIQALDDPFMTQEILPVADELSASTVMELCAHGGHVGFVGGRYPGREEYWLEQRIPKFLASYW